MPNQRLIAILTMLVMTGSGNAARSELSLDDLQAVEGLIQGGDCSALWEHLRVNPQLRRGDDPVAAELSDFFNSTRLGNLDCYSGRGALFAPATQSENY